MTGIATIPVDHSVCFLVHGAVLLEISYIHVHDLRPTLYENELGLGAIQAWNLDRKLRPKLTKEARTLDSAVFDSSTQV